LVALGCDWLKIYCLQNNIFKILAGVMWLGNLGYKESKDKATIGDKAGKFILNGANAL
jgi:myosin heavy subunit